MAKTTTVHITDDLDGSKNATEVSFSYEGTAYTIDLSAKNKTAFEKLLKPYVDSATRVSGRGRSRAGARKGPSRDLAAIRAWALDQGITVSERGRVASSVIEQYEAAH